MPASCPFSHCQLRRSVSEEGLPEVAGKKEQVEATAAFAPAPRCAASEQAAQAAEAALLKASAAETEAETEDGTGAEAEDRTGAEAEDGAGAEAEAEGNDEAAAQADLNASAATEITLGQDEPLPMPAEVSQGDAAPPSAPGAERVMPTSQLRKVHVQSSESSSPAASPAPEPHREGTQSVELRSQQPPGQENGDDGSELETEI